MTKGKEIRLLRRLVTFQFALIIFLICVIGLLSGNCQARDIQIGRSYNITQIKEGNSSYDVNGEIRIFDDRLTIEIFPYYEVLLKVDTAFTRRGRKFYKLSRPDQRNGNTVLYKVSCVTQSFATKYMETEAQESGYIFVEAKVDKLYRAMKYEYNGAKTIKTPR